MEEYPAEYSGMSALHKTEGLIGAISFALFVGIYGIATLIKEKMHKNFTSLQIVEYLPYTPIAHDFPGILSSALEKIIRMI